MYPNLALLVALVISAAVTLPATYAVGIVISKFAFRSLTPLPRAAAVMGIATVLVWTGLNTAYNLWNHTPLSLQDLLSDAPAALPGGVLAWWIFWRNQKRIWDGIANTFS